MIFLCSLFFIVLSHELGHLLAAKWLKCGVKTFSVGFGKPFFKRKFGQTVYQLAPFLLGGYCELDHELVYSRSKYAFTNKTYKQKVIISLAGVAVNCWISLVSYLLYTITLTPFFLIFGCYSMALGVSNLLPIPCLDGFYPILFLFEKMWGKKKTYKIWEKINNKIFIILIILNVASLPYLGWMIWKGMIL